MSAMGITCALASAWERSVMRALSLDFTLVQTIVPSDPRGGVSIRLIPAREKADSEGLRRFESDGVNS